MKMFSMKIANFKPTNPNRISIMLLGILETKILRSLTNSYTSHAIKPKKVNIDSI